MVNIQFCSSQVFPNFRCSYLRKNLFFPLIFTFSLCIFPLNAQAADVTLAWDPPSSEYEGFILSYGIGSGAYSETQDVGTVTTHTLTNLDPGKTYFFAVKAYNTNHNEESTYSNEVYATVPSVDTKAPGTPKDVKIVF